MIPSASFSSTRPGPRRIWPDTHGRCARGERLRAGVPHGHWKTTTFVAGLRIDGIAAPFVLDGPINRNAFEIYVAKVLVPELKPGDIVVMDNLSSHKGPAIRAMIAAAGASLLVSAALQPRLQPDRKSLLETQSASAKGRRADCQWPLGRHRPSHRSLHAARMRKLLRRRRLRCNLNEKRSSIKPEKSEPEALG